jgi:hypothetical protein
MVGEKCMKRKKILSIVVLLLIGVLLTRVEVIRYLVNDAIYFSKANNEYVSKEYSIDIENTSNSGKNYAFWGKDKETNKLVYIIFVFRKGIYLVDGDEGVEEARINEIASQFDKLQFNISLDVIETFSEKKSIKKYMYWVVEYEDSTIRYFRFLDGLSENPFD